MRSREMRLAAFEREQAAHAAHMRRGERILGVFFLEIIAEHIKGIVMRADADNGVLDIAGRAQ